MKDRWKFCQCCYLNGHCENQDRGHKCEHYAKQLEDKVDRLQEQLEEANRLIKRASSLFDYGSANIDAELSDFSIYLKKWGVK